ncbi:threonine dehydrogenase-like Zn-dependent dehydrogenase [Nakamurella flavida]|nr:zinc-binding dehydrogenase [Nakamurella flavida]MDP9778884.1 threonine dehydrogenase-like Zn-dependent dehydrogenase [Nakamurella flavida]
MPTASTVPTVADLPTTMRGVYLPGNSTTVLRDDIPVPTPGVGQVLLAVGASTICGSDVRAIYREHLGSGPEGYNDVIAGHEPAGTVVAVGPGCRRLSVGDRVAVYHITGCGQCAECRRGYFISCTSPLRSAYGWQRDGGHGDYLLAEEVTCVTLPDALSFVDGACIACGFSTAYEALTRLHISGEDSVLVTGLGPVGLAAGLLARKLGGRPVLGTDPSPERSQLALDLGAVDEVVSPEDLAGSRAGSVTAAVDCSGSGAGRRTALLALARWGRMAFVGEGGRMDFDVSHEVIHRQITLIGSWVSSVGRMAELMDRLVVWDLHPEVVVSHRFDLADSATAYQLVDQGRSGKVALVPGHHA